MMVYRTQEYKDAAKGYFDISEQQRNLLKKNKKNELLGRDPNPAKSQFQANLSRQILLKREVFTVSNCLR